MHVEDREALEMFADYQASQSLAATTIRNRASILKTLARNSPNGLVNCDVFTLRRHIGRDGVTKGTKRTERGAFIAFFTFLYDDGLRADNPAAKLPTINVPKGKPRPFTRAQVDAMLESGAYRKTRAMILVGYFQGFRVSQIARVRGDDIDMLTNTIYTIGKGRKEGRLPLHPVIRELAASMPERDWWFPARKDATTHMRAASVTDLITKAKLRAGILDPRLTPHSLRHGFGTDLVDGGVDIRVVQELMMHESLSTTQVYTGISEERKQADIVTLQPRRIPERSGRQHLEAA